jgi:peptidoglycan hydrolase-like protein with peptidoglycan-binding domain
MLKARNVATLLALTSLAVFPACSMFGGDNSRTQASRNPRQGYASTQQNYPSPQSPELTQGMIRQVQDRLQQEGLYRGRVDGIWGPATESAVHSYQQQHNLNTTGKLDVDTLAALNLGTNPNYGSTQPQPPRQQHGSSSNPPPTTNPPASDATQPAPTGPR